MPAARYFRGEKQIEPKRVNIAIHPDLLLAAKKAAKEAGSFSALVAQLLAARLNWRPKGAA
jgi:hypothetical protein